MTTSTPLARYPQQRKISSPPFSDPERLARWWGPAGFTNTFHTFEFVAGGRWGYTMHSPNGGNPANESVFERVELNKVVIRHVSQPLYRLTIGLESTETGRVFLGRRSLTIRMLRAASKRSLSGRTRRIWIDYPMRSDRRPDLVLIFFDIDCVRQLCNR